MGSEGFRFGGLSVRRGRVDKGQRHSAEERGHRYMQWVLAATVVIVSRYWTAGGVVIEEGSGREIRAIIHRVASGRGP